MRTALSCSRTGRKKKVEMKFFPIALIYDINRHIHTHSGKHFLEHSALLFLEFKYQIQ